MAAQVQVMSQNKRVERRAEADRLLDIVAPVSYLFPLHAQKFIRQTSSGNYWISERQLAWLRRLANEFYGM
jgi:hypothetical protein